MPLSISYDENLIAEIKSKFDLRRPNVEALQAIVKRLESGNFRPQEQLLLDLATGVGKTYIMAAMVEYLRRQGITNVMIVTPNTVVQNKTVADFSLGSNRYIGGFDVPPELVTPDDVRKLSLDSQDSFMAAGREKSTVYIFNVQQLFPPKDGGKNEATGVEGQRRKTWRFQEETGVLAERLIDFDNLVIIVDEAHLFGTSAARFQDALKAFEPAATIGLTASAAGQDVEYRYPLWQAIKDKYVKQPVLVYRQSGYNSDERQLQDAISLLRIKEEAYRDYRENNPGVRQTKPVLFVVCTDVKHATETATTLRNTFFTDANSAQAVLQVDNEHNDAVTQTLLRNLDETHSPVRVIVSVNKLREGWDTKRIAVMCTLRAMGSEVLTQQVMGRGLRLPFGKITDHPAIDELEIISHKSFVTLLKSENVLREFGIEEKVSDSDFDPNKIIIPPASTTDGNSELTGNASTNASNGDTEARAFDPSKTTDAPSASDHQPGQHAGTGPVSARGIADDEDITDIAPRYKPVIVSVNQQFENTTFLFPSSVMLETQRPFNLLYLEDEDVIKAAEKVQDLLENLERTRIGVDDKHGKLVAEHLDRAAVPSFRQTEEIVKKELIKRAVETRTFQADRLNHSVLEKRIVPLLMGNSRVTQWTEKAKQSAVRALVELIRSGATKAAAKNTSNEVRVVPVELPVETTVVLKEGHSVRNCLAVDSKSTKQTTRFQEKQYYGPWTKGLFEAANFDSFSAEYCLAHVLNFDPAVEWWTRIYADQGAKIAYTTRNNYIPDFVVKDSEGTFWIVEGKADNEKDDDVVAKKRKATERVLRSLIVEPEYDGQSWAYLIAFEADIKKADSFKDLIAAGGVERMLPI